MNEIPVTEEEWQVKLDPERFQVLRRGATEAPFSGKYNHEKRSGMYRCAGCGAELFSSDAKYDSGSGWPSFFAPVAEGKIDENVDRAHGMVRREIVCHNCGGHLGHVFDDGPRPTGLRYCVNSASLELDPS